MSESKMFYVELSKWTWSLGIYVVYFARGKELDIHLNLFILSFRLCSGLERGITFVNHWKR